MQSEMVKGLYDLKKSRQMLFTKLRSSYSITVLKRNGEKRCSLKRGVAFYEEASNFCQYLRIRMLSDNASYSFCFPFLEPDVNTHSVSAGCF